MKRLVLDSKGYGITISATLTFPAVLNFDPTGGTALLQVANQPERPMALDGPVATYVTVPNDFTRGRYIALVEVLKSGTRVTSERFQLEIL